MKKKTDKFPIYFFLVLFAALAAISSCVAAAYLADPYRVFSVVEPGYETSFEPNTRFIKTDFLAGNCRKFDAMVLGSSRVISYKTSAVDSLYGLNSYNFGVSDDTLTGVLQNSNGSSVRVVFQRPSSLKSRSTGSTSGISRRPTTS